MEDRHLRVGAVAVRSVEDAAFVRFCLVQLVTEDKFVLGYAPTGSTSYEIGIVAQEEDLDSIRKVLAVLDEAKIYYETNFNLPTT